MLNRLGIPRDKLRQGLRKFLLWLVGGVIVAIIVAALGEWVIRLLEEQGFYAKPTRRAGRAMSAVGSFIASARFLVPASFVVGLTVGVWLDWLLRSLEKNQAAMSAQLSETPRALAQALDDLYAEGTRERNRLIPPLTNFDYAAERAKLVAWKQRILEKINVEHVTVKEYSAFRTLRDFEGWAHRVPDKTEQQDHIEAMWNEHLSRLRSIIDRIGS